MAAEKKMKEYGIAFKGLKDGEHLFEYRLGNAFFEMFEQPQIETGDLKATVTLLKSSRMLELIFSIEGEVGVLCDRCLSDLNTPVKFDGTMYVNFGEEYDEPTEEIIVLPHESHSINVARFMYEFIVVSLPIRHVHPANEDGTPGCDPDMLEQLDQYLVDEETQPESEQDDENEDESIDPRWGELRKLINKNNK
jgi:uncharacterized protein